MRKAGGIISLIAGVFGVICAFVTLLLGGIGSAFNASGAGTVVGLGWGGVLFSFLVIIFGAIAISAKGKTIGILLIISSIAGAILGGTLVAIFMVLALIGGVLALLGTGNKSEEITKENLSPPILENEFIVCQKCGEKNPAVNDYCRKCAASLKENLRPPLKRKSNESLKVLGLALFGIVGVVILFIIIITIGNGSNSNKLNSANVNSTTKSSETDSTVTEQAKKAADDKTRSDKVEADKVGADEVVTDTAPKTMNYEATLTNGHFIAGVDFPAGTYDIEAVSGGGNVSSSNGEINAIMGIDGKNEMFQQKYSNIKLDKGITLSISGVGVKITSKDASTEPLNKRQEVVSEKITLSNGNFTAGTDFTAGTFNIVAVKGGGNISSSNGEINAIMGIDGNDEMFQQKYFNIELDNGSIIKIDRVTVDLIPVK